MDVFSFGYHCYGAAMDVFTFGHLALFTIMQVHRWVCAQLQGLGEVIAIVCCVEIPWGAPDQPVSSP